MRDCWNTIGVRGDASCSELARYVNCYNCPVHAAAALELLDSPPPDGYQQEWTALFAQPARDLEPDGQSVVVFRVGTEWFALPASVVVEVSDVRPTHSLPHRRGGIAIGITNVRGELLVCASLAAILGIGAAAEPAHARPSAGRLLVLRRDDVRAACPVDEIHGVERVRRRDLREVPTTLAKAASRFSTQLMTVQARSVGLLDDAQVFHALKKALA